MTRSKHSEAQIIAALKQVEAGRTAEDVAREQGVSKHTIYAWKAKYGGMEVSEAEELGASTHSSRKIVREGVLSFCPTLRARPVSERGSRLPRPSGPQSAIGVRPLRVMIRTKNERTRMWVAFDQFFGPGRRAVAQLADFFTRDSHP
jgi:hypothetical protein